MFVSTDKNQNYCEITKENYNKILHDDITKVFKKAVVFIKAALNVNQRQNSSEVIKWFKNMENKKLHTFVVFKI